MTVPPRELEPALLLWLLSSYDVYSWQRTRGEEGVMLSVWTRTRRRRRVRKWMHLVRLAAAAAADRPPNFEADTDGC